MLVKYKKISFPDPWPEPEPMPDVENPTYLTDPKNMANVMRGLMLVTCEKPTQTLLASVLGLDPSSATVWKMGRRPIPEKHLKKLKALAKLATDIDKEIERAFESIFGDE